MEKALLLEAEIRKDTGTRSAEKIRRQGRIPAIVYGHKKEAVGISLNAHDFIEGLHHGHRLMEVAIGKKKENIIVKDIQYDYLGKNVIHADLMRVDISERVKVSVPIEIKGTAKGASEGGIIIEHTNSLEVECKVTDIPEVIRISVKEMELGDSIHAGDIELPEGVVLVSDSGLLIAGCNIVAAAKSAEELEEAEPVTPEVISKGKEEAEEGEASKE